MDNSVNRKYRILFYLTWLCLGLIQARYTELQDDEAYYWVYSHYLAWGYFDHPPMIAWLIKAGYSLLHNELGVRLLTLLLNFWALMIIESLTARKNPKLFYAIALSMAVFQVWGFLAVPDIPLIFFTAMFFWCYRAFTQKAGAWQTLALALSITLLCYSKYQAALVVIFTFLSNPKLIKQTQAWAAAGLVILLYSPHLYWQYQHNWISFKYHLFESNVSAWKFSYTTDYILSQLVLAGPLVFFILMPAALLHKPADKTERAMRFTLIGVYLFFFLSSFRGRVEGNWTSPVLPAFVVLAHQYLMNKEQWQKWLYRLLPITMILVLAFRIEMLADLVPVKMLQERYHSWKPWPAELNKKLNGVPVVFSNSYQRASKYWFYSGTMSYSQNFYRNRLNNYNYWPVEDSLLGKPVYYADIYDLSYFPETVQTGIGPLGLKYDSTFASFAKLQIETQSSYTVKQGDTLTVEGPANMPALYRNYIDSHTNLQDTIRIGLFQKRTWIKDIYTDVSLHQIAATGRFQYKTDPALPAGKYDMIIAIHCRNYRPTHNSQKINLTIN